MTNEKKRFVKLYPCLQKDYSSFKSLFSLALLKAVPYLSIGKTLDNLLNKYFRNNSLRTSFTFQSKYLGMSPWECPALFTMIPFIEHYYGIYHVKGGLNMISNAMAKVIEEENGEINYNTNVKNIIIEKGKAKGLLLDNGEKVFADEVVINSDFSYSMLNLLGDNKVKKYSKKKLEKRKYSCSTFMIYLGLNKCYDLNHHNVFFASDYKKNIDNIINHKQLDDNISFYVQNAVVSDDTLAPKGKSTIYILVPVANNTSKIDWNEIKDVFKNKIYKKIIDKTNYTDFKESIEVERIITPDEWENKANVYKGAVFNLGHNLSQLLYLRPRNAFEGIKNTYLVGGGTHPGSGLPTIYESGRISANLISKKYNIK